MKGRGFLGHLGDRRGFTLVELAVAVAIAGVVAMLAVPSMRGLMPRIQLSNDMVTLSNEIALARARAIAKNNEFRIIFNTADSSYTLRNETKNANIARNTTSGNVKLYAAFNLGAMKTIAMRPVGTVGYVDGGAFKDLALGSRAAIYLRTQDGKQRKRVLVEATGRMTVERWAGGSTWVED